MDINRKSSKGIAILLALNLMGSVMCPDYAWALRRMAAAEDRMDRLAKILIIDNSIDPYWRKSISYKLRNKGYEVVAADNIEEVMAKLEKEKFETIIMDTAGEKELELLKEIKGEYSDIPVIMVGMDIQYLKKSVDQGANSYCIRGNEEELLAKVDIYSKEMPEGTPAISTNPTILIVDDGDYLSIDRENSAITWDVRDVLKKDGYDVITVGNFQKAKEILETREIYLVVSSLGMDSELEGEGSNLIKLIKEGYEVRDIGFIQLGNNAEDKEIALGLGVDDWCNRSYPAVLSDIYPSHVNWVSLNLLLLNTVRKYSKSPERNEQLEPLTIMLKTSVRFQKRRKELQNLKNGISHLISLLSGSMAGLSASDIESLLNIFSKEKFAEDLMNKVQLESLSKKDVSDETLWQIRPFLQRLSLARSLRSGEIVHIRRGKKIARAVILESMAESFPQIKALTIDVLGESQNLFALPDSPEIIELSAEQIFSLNIDFERELIIKTDEYINIGDRIEAEYKGKKVVVTVVKDYEGVLVLIAQHRLDDSGIIAKPGLAKRISLFLKGVLNRQLTKKVIPQQQLDLKINSGYGILVEKKPLIKQMQLLKGTYRRVKTEEELPVVALELKSLQSELSRAEKETEETKKEIVKAEKEASDFQRKLIILTKPGDDYYFSYLISVSRSLYDKLSGLKTRREDLENKLKLFTQSQEAEKIEIQKESRAVEVSL